MSILQNDYVRFEYGMIFIIIAIFLHSLPVNYDFVVIATPSKNMYWGFSADYRSNFTDESRAIYHATIVYSFCPHISMLANICFHTVFNFKRSRIA